METITYDGLKQHPKLKAQILHSINMMKLVIEADKMDLADISSNLINRCALITELAHEVYEEHNKQLHKETAMP